MTRSVRKTPVRNALLENSSLQTLVNDGLGSVKPADRNYFHAPIRQTFADSLDLDEALRLGREQENRWDYLLGHEPSGEVVAVEPHSAKQDEVSAVIRKRVAAKAQLQEHLRGGVHITRWLWVASGNVQFADTEKTRRLLDQNGIEFAGKQIGAKHLPVGNIPAAKALGRKRKR